MTPALVLALGVGQVEVGVDTFPVERVELDGGTLSFSAGLATFQMFASEGVRAERSHIVLKVTRIQILTTPPATIGCEIELVADGRTRRTAYRKGRIAEEPRLKLQWRASRRLAL